MDDETVMRRDECQLEIVGGRAARAVEPNPKGRRPSTSSQKEHAEIMIQRRSAYRDVNISELKKFVQTVIGAKTTGKGSPAIQYTGDILVRNRCISRN